MGWTLTPNGSKTLPAVFPDTTETYPMPRQSPPLQYAPRHRRISGLLSARRLDCRPPSIPIGRPRGAKAAGMRYQRLVEKALLAAFPGSGLDVGPWFEFTDSAGRGYCQPDALMYNITDDSYMIIEIKLSNFQAAEAQITELYKPVIERAIGSRVSGMIVLKNLSPEVPAARIFDDFRRAMVCAQCEWFPVWHWLGHGGIAKATLAHSCATAG